MRYFQLGPDYLGQNCLDEPVCKQFKKQFEQRFSPKHVGTKSSPPANTVAALLISELDLENLEVNLRRFSKGYAVRSANQARRDGFLHSIFDWNSHLDEIHRINTSLPERNDRPMSAAYNRSPEQLRVRGLAESSKCLIHWIKNFGVFSPDGELVAYLRLKRQGQILIYTTILGHGDYLSKGVMYLLHHETLRHLARDQDCSDTLLVYSSFNSGTDGLKQWKRRGLFEEFSISQSS